MLAVIAAVAVPWTLASAARGRLLYGKHLETILVTLAVVTAAVTLVDWIERLLFA